MKVEDLMIGDWYYWEAESKKYPMQVTKDTFRLSDEDISNFQPIPLTPKILKKNGLINHHNGSYFKEDKYLLLEISSSKDGIVWTIDFHEYDILKLEYVHQLQHALRLCRIDKEITL